MVVKCGSTKAIKLSLMEEYFTQFVFKLKFKKIKLTLKVSTSISLATFPALNVQVMLAANSDGWLHVNLTSQWVTQIQLSSVQSLSRVQLFETPWIAARQASLSITNSRSLFKLMSIESVMPSSHLILCRPLLLLPPIPPSIRVFSNESTLRIRWPKYWSFSFNISPSNEHPGLIFRMDWWDLLAVHGTLKSLLQNQFYHFWVCLWEWFWMRLAFESMHTLKQIALSRVGGHPPTCWGPG